MPRVTFVKSARKDNPVAKKGESYYWWKFRYGGKRYSLTRPRPSQLTQSAYYGTVRSLIEQVEDAGTPEDNDALTGLRDEIKDELGSLLDETQGSLDNMPDQLQYSPTGELLQERIDAIEYAMGEIENIEEFEEEEPEESDFTPMGEQCEKCEGEGVCTDLLTDEEVTCPDCDGEGEVESDDDSDYQDALQSWEDDKQQHMEEAVSNMMDELSNCEV